MLSFLFYEGQFFMRAVFALLFSFSFMILFGNRFIELIKKIYTAGQPVNIDGPKSHLAKQGTPTLGGILIIIAVLFSTLLFGNLTNPFLLIVLIAPLPFAVLGFVDDYRKIMRKTMPGYENQCGLSAKTRLVVEFLTAGLALFFITVHTPFFSQTIINIPYLSFLSFDAGYFYYLFACVAIVGFSNAVNITDGADGLATKTSLISNSVFILLMFLSSNILFSSINGLSYIPYTYELIVFAFALMGALLGFLFFNAKPASIFMGDVGSLYIGSIFGLFAVILKVELLFAVFGFIFVAELGSSFFQKFYYKMTKINLDGSPITFREKLTKIQGVTGKKIFKMAPLHHHYEMKGIPETKVVDQFFVMSIIFGAIAILSLFIRI